MNASATNSGGINSGATDSSGLPACAGGRPVRTRDRFLVFGQPVLGDTEIDAVVDCLRRRWIGTGPKVHQFEQAFAACRGSPEAVAPFAVAPFAVAVGSCTAALHLSILALGITVGDEVITTPMTFCATINAIIHTGATPVLADCDRWTQNLTAEAIEAKITPRTKAILVVHMCGRPCDMDAIMAVARRHKLLVVEDCAHAIEATIDGRPVGTFGDVGCFSFYATKNITTAEGGMVLTSDEALADRIKILGLHGLSKDAWKRFADAGYQHYEVVSSGYKCNMTDLQAALGLAQLVQIEQFARRRTELWEIYNQAFADLPCDLPPAPAPGTGHAHHLYTPILRLEHLRADRDAVLDAMTAENIGVGVHYLAITQHRYYRDTFGWRSEDVPNAEFIGARTLSLPLSAGLDDQDAADVCQAFRRILLHFAA